MSSQPSKRAIRKEVDTAFVALVLDLLHRNGLHRNGTDLSLEWCVAALKEGQIHGVPPTADAVQMIVDELRIEADAAVKSAENPDVC